jgi:preprotein translocase subunit SecG
VTKVTPPAGYENFTAQDIAKFEDQTGNLFTDLIRNKIPLGNIFGKGAWSLLSLLLSLIAVVCSVLLILWTVIRRRRRDDGHDRDTYADENGETVKKKNAGILRALTVIAGVLTPIVWLILDDLNQPMVWINKWTLFVGIVFIVHIVLLLVYKSRNNRKERDSEAEAEYGTIQ